MPSSDSDCSMFRGRSIAIIPFPALGDTTIYLRLAQTLARSGARVFFYSDLLTSAADMLPWLTTKPFSFLHMDDLTVQHDLVIADVLAKPVAEWTRLKKTPASISNLIATTAKHMPSDFVAPPVRIFVAEAGVDNLSPHRAICLGAEYGPSMVEWVDRYALKVFGLTPSEAPPQLTPPANWFPDLDCCRRVLIFPTTPNPSKNYPLQGFAKLSAKLEANGWVTDIICLSHEVHETSRMFDARKIRTFPTLRELILHMMQSRAVISNDSGRGHLGSMLGLPTHTITKKSVDFVWRPGFGKNNQVVSPTMTFKWVSGRVWRPFIPLRRILTSLGKAAPPSLVYERKCS